MFFKVNFQAYKQFLKQKWENVLRCRESDKNCLIFQHSTLWGSNLRAQRCLTCQIGRVAFNWGRDNFLVLWLEMDYIKDIIFSLYNFLKGGIF